MKRALLLLLIIAVPQVMGVAIGANRASINFEDVLRDGYARADVVVTTDSTEPIYAEILLSEGEAYPWLNFTSKNFTFSRDSPYRIYIEALPPPDARIESYRVNMSILTGELSRGEGGLVGTTARASLGIPIFLHMTGTERRECKVGGVTVYDTESSQELEVALSIINTGNVRVNPSVEIDVLDKLRSESVLQDTATFGASVLPTLSEESSVFYSISLPRDQYWTLVKVPECGYTGMFTFDVLDAGEVKDDGEFIRIDADSRVGVGDIVPIEAIFRNRGVRSVRANFRGTIENADTGEVVKVINTDTYIVEPSQTVPIETFFNPVVVGRYSVRGKVFYNDKLTIERSVIVNVDEGGIRFGSMSAQRLFFLVLLLVIIFFLILIIRRKKRRRYNA